MRMPMVALLSSLVLATLPTLDTAHADTLDTIRSRGTIVIGYREGAPPFSSVDVGQNQPRGYSIDLCNRIADAVKSALGISDLKVQYVPVNAENRIDKLKSGAIDIECGSTTRTLSRQEQVDFTLFTFVTGTEMLVRQDSDIRGPENLKGKKIAVQPGTTTEVVIKQLVATNGAQLVPVQSSDQGLALVVNGKADAYASDEVVLIGLGTASKSPRLLRLTGRLYSYEPYALMVRRDDAAFRLIADRTLAATYQSDDIGKIWQRWFGQWLREPPPLLRFMYAMESLVQ
jgi:glutamate/aspartate transport system substrate-binding protein